MIRPTTIPQTLEELQIEQAIAREALRLALEQHRQLAVGLKGVQSERDLSDVFDQGSTGDSLVSMMSLDLIIGSGGVLSHAPRRAQTAAMLVDAFMPEGVTRLAVDSIFMMPHLGVLSTIHEKAANDVFDHDCLVNLGTCVAPIGVLDGGAPCLNYELRSNDGTASGELNGGDISLIPLTGDGTLTLSPGRKADVGAGPGQEVSVDVAGGEVGLIFDGRGRPIGFSNDPADRAATTSGWADAFGMYT